MSCPWQLEVYRTSFLVNFLSYNSSNEGADPYDIKKTLIALIQKVKNPTHAGERRPIILFNVFKLVTKTMANRLKIILANIVGEEQSDFVSNKFIIDNAPVAFECFHYMKKRITWRRGAMALKLDISKSYNRVEWKFPEKVLTHMRFPHHWVDLIIDVYLQLLSLSFFCKLPSTHWIQNLIGVYVKVTHPISLYLFILCAEVFSTMIHRAVTNRTLHGIKIRHFALSMTPLLFADNNILFSRATII